MLSLEKKHLRKAAHSAFCRCLCTHKTHCFNRQGTLVAHITCQRSKPCNTPEEESRTGSRACSLQETCLPLTQQCCWPFCEKKLRSICLAGKKSSKCDPSRKKAQSTASHRTHPQQSKKLLLGMCTPTDSVAKSQSRVSKTAPAQSQEQSVLAE